MPEAYDVDAMARGYLTAVVFTTTDDEGKPLVRGPGDIGEACLDYAEEHAAEATWTDALAVCTAYAAESAADLEGMDPEQAGHDLWFTRCGHGCGFWDRGLGERGERLSATARALGEAWAYLGDDGRLYVQ